MRIQLSFVVALMVAVSFGSASQAALVTGTFSGSVTNASFNIPISAGDAVAGVFGYDTNAAVIDPSQSFNSPGNNSTWYDFPVARPSSFLEITVNGFVWASGTGFAVRVNDTSIPGFGVGDTVFLWGVNTGDTPVSFPGSFGAGQDLLVAAIGDWGQIGTDTIFSTTNLPTSIADFDFSAVDPTLCCGGQVFSTDGTASWDFNFAIDPNSLTLGLARENVGIPEPSSTGLLALGLVGLLASRRRRS